MNHHDTSLAQLSILDKLPRLVGFSKTYSYMSSAYWWSWTLCWVQRDDIANWRHVHTKKKHQF